MKKLVYFFAFTCMVLLNSFVVSAQESVYVHPSIKQALLRTSKVDIIILFKEQADLSLAKSIHGKDAKATFVYNALKTTCSTSQKNVIALLNSRNIPFESHYLINGIKTNVNQELLNLLSQRNDIKAIYLDSPIKIEIPKREISTGQSRGPSSVEWGLSMIQADSVWNMGITGEGAVIAGEDTGYDWTHPAIQKKYRGWNETTQTADHNYNWRDAIHSYSPLSSDTINPCGYNITAPCDDNSHGTHTMGTMVGDDGAGNQIGVAPGAKWIACRNMERGNGAPSTYIECFEFFLAPTDINGENADPTKAPHVINNSWYCSEGEGCNPSNFEFMHTAVTNLKAAGVVVVVSNGNFGGPCNTSNNPPAFFAESFSVGATTSIDSIASFSSRGPVTIDGSNRTKPDISAPGQDVRSSIPNGGYANYSGTSMAGPHVAGVVGLMVSANPAIAGEVETIENIIKTTAIPRTSGDLCGTVEGWNIPNNTYGHGRINAFEAVKSALLYTPNKEINTYREGEIDIFPNPFYNYLDIDLKGNDWNGVAYFKLYDASGKEIMFDKWNTELSKSVRINIPAGLNSGMYYYQIVAEHSRACGKLIK